MRHGDQVRIDGHLADDRGQVDRGAARVVGANPTYTDERGVDRVIVQTDRGELLSVPRKAVRN